MQDATYILPVRHQQPTDVSELTAYLRWLDQHVDLIVVDGSPAPVFAGHATAWDGLRHVVPAPEHACGNGKVHGVLTGLALATHDRVVIADEDVRYDGSSLDKLVSLLDHADVVRPQNYFEPLPWHARWDSARSLINRVTGGDWPGTLAVRRSFLENGYNGDCLFENLELVRTVCAAGGSELVASNVFVRRLPPDDSHFLSQRIRQAYDEFARPGRLAWQLALLPTAVVALKTRPQILVVAAATAIGLAEAGRQRDHATSVFPQSTSLFAPLWLAERAVCSWLAVFCRLRFGGVPYSNRIITRAATPMKELIEAA